MNFFEKITDKLCLGERGIKDVLGLVLIIGVMAGAVLANADAGMWGVSGEWNLLVSVLYILFWLVFFLALAGLVTTVPFFGLTVFGHGMSGMFEIYYPLLALLALVWVLYMRFFLKKNN